MANILKTIMLSQENQAYTKKFREQPSLKHPMPCAGQKEKSWSFPQDMY